MNVLLSGSNGFIGRSLLRRLTDAGHRVHALVRADAAPEAGVARFDLAERRIDASALPDGTLEGFDAVVHLGGEPITAARWSPAKRERIRASRVATTDVLARALARLESPPAVFISASAVGYYGDRGDEVLDERSPGGEGFLAEVCRNWETATSPAREAGVRVVSLRSGLVLDRGGGALRTQLPMFRLGLGGALCSGAQWTSFIALEDEVAAIVHLIGATVSPGPVNLTAPQPVRNRDFAAALGHALHRPSIVRVPHAALRLALGKAVTDEVVCAGQRAVPRQLQASGFIFARPNIEEALDAALGVPERPSRLHAPRRGRRAGMAR